MRRKMPEEDNDKDSKAVALQYDKEHDPAPRVVAKGQGEIARQIIEVAEAKGIEIKRDANLVEILHALELDSFIPLEAYSAVAEILSYIYSKNAAKRR